MIEISINKKLHSAGGQSNLEFDLSIKKGQFITLFGESGAGKTSILNIISGLLKPDSGSIKVNGFYWYHSERVNLSPQKRKVGYFFQDYALFPNMTVLENLEFALGKREDHGIINQLIDLTELQELVHRKPETLSGGQKQRVALARALVQKPEILLLDEPFSALDFKMRLKLQEYIQQVHQKYELTTIMVSHDIGEILKLSDYVVELKAGAIVKQGNSSDFFGLDQSSAKFKFTGEILAIKKADVVFIITVLIGHDMIKVISDPQEAAQLKIGDKVSVASKAFNPIIRKI